MYFQNCTKRVKNLFKLLNKLKRFEEFIIIFVQMPEMKDLAKLV